MTVNLDQHPPVSGAPAAKPLPYQNRGDLTHPPIPKLMVRLTIPMIWGILAIISVQLASTYFVSLLGTQELAGISFTFPVTMLISHLVFGLNIAISSVVSRLIGQKRHADAHRVILHAIVLGVATSAFISILCFIFLEKIFTLMGADGENLKVILQYMPLWLLSSVILAIPVSANSALRASGEALMPALIMTGLAFFNILLDPALIFGLAGLPRLEVAGAAWATLIANSGAAVLALYVLTVRRGLIDWRHWHLEMFGDSVRRLMVIALPAGITNIIQPLSSVIITSLLAGYGAQTVAGYGVATRIEAFALIVIMALSIGMAPIIGQNWGAGLYNRVHETISRAIAFNYMWSLGVAIVLALAGPYIAGAFSEDPAVQHAACLYFWIIPLSYGLGNLVYGWGSAFNAMGMPQRSFIMILVKAFVFTLPLVALGSYLAGPAGIFTGIACANVFSGIIFHITCKKAMLSLEPVSERPAAVPF